MSTHLNIGSVAGSEGAQNFVGIFHGPITLNQRDNHERTQKLIDDPLREALFLTDPYTDRESLVSTKGKRVAGTCQWIIEHPNYLSWLKNDIRLLWISGGPGKGKTIMSIFLSEELEKMSVATATRAMFYFCSHQDEKRNTALTILRGLIHQIITQVPLLTKQVEPFFENRIRRDQAISSMETLWLVFKSIITDAGLPPTFCVLDGLDECDEQTLQLLVPRLVDFFASDSPASIPTNFKLAIVSRDILGLRGCMQIKLDPDNNDKVISDIERFVTARVGELSRVAGVDHDVRTHIKKTLLDRAEGTFLWVGFAMFELSQKPTCSQIMETLEQIPRGLSAVYARMLLRIPQEKRQSSSKLLRWITMALRPLSIVEIAAVMDVEEISPMLDKRRRVLDEISLCGPFLKVESTVIELVHQSARDYLLRPERDNNLVLEAFRIDVEETHLELARICLERILRYTQRNPSLSEGQRITKDSKDYPLMLYAMTQLAKHIQGCSPPALQLIESFQRVVTMDDSLRARWRQAAAEICDGVWTGFPSPLHASCYLGIAHWVEKFSRTSLWRPRRHKWLHMKNAADGFTPLHLAARRGSERIVQILLDRGAYIDATDNDGRSALHFAVFYKFEPLANMLLSRGSQKDLQANDGRTPLHVAVSERTTSMTQPLLENNVSLKVRTRTQMTPLHHAAWAGRKENTRLLLHNGVDTSAVDTSGRTALHLAAYQGHGEVVRVLLEGGLDINVRDEDGETALETAAAAGQDAVVRQLIRAAAKA